MAGNVWSESEVKDAQTFLTYTKLARDSSRAAAKTLRQSSLIYIGDRLISEHPRKYRSSHKCTALLAKAWTIRQRARGMPLT